MIKSAPRPTLKWIHAWNYGAMQYPLEDFYPDNDPPSVSVAQSIPEGLVSEATEKKPQDTVRLTTDLLNAKQPDRWTEEQAARYRAQLLLQQLPLKSNDPVSPHDRVTISLESAELGNNKDKKKRDSDESGTGAYQNPAEEKFSKSLPFEKGIPSLRFRTRQPRLAA